MVGNPRASFPQGGRRCCEFEDPVLVRLLLLVLVVPIGEVGPSAGTEGSAKCRIARVDRTRPLGQGCLPGKTIPTGRSGGCGDHAAVSTTLRDGSVVDDRSLLEDPLDGY